MIHNLRDNRHSIYFAYTNDSSYFVFAMTWISILRNSVLHCLQHVNIALQHFRDAYLKDLIKLIHVNLCFGNRFVFAQVFIACANLDRGRESNTYHFPPKDGFTNENKLNNNTKELHSICTVNAPYNDHILLRLSPFQYNDRSKMSDMYNRSCSIIFTSNTTINFTNSSHPCIRDCGICFRNILLMLY